MYVNLGARKGVQVNRPVHPGVHLNKKTKQFMAGLSKRNGMWYATWKQAGATVKKSTGIQVKEKGMSAAKAEALARQTAEMMEQAAKGKTACSRALEAVRAAAVAYGAAAQMPSVREYLGGIPRHATASAEANRSRAFNRFIDSLGRAAELGIDTVTPAQCDAFCREMIKHVSRGTVEGYRVYLSAAFNRAVNVDGLIDRNPWKAVNLGQIAAAVNPSRGNDKIERQPFSLHEIKKMIDKLPAPWCDMVAVSYYGYGLRLSDVCLMRWDDVNWNAGYIHLIEMKTKKDRYLPMSDELRARLVDVQSMQDGTEEYVFPLMAHYYLGSCRGYVSMQFTALLRAHGIIPAVQDAPKEGRRHRVSQKSFHSIRHTVVSCLRADATFTADIVCDAVGQCNKVQEGYFTASMEQRARVGDALAAKLNVTGAEYTQRTA